MKMASSSVFGIVLAVALFSTGVVADRLTNVYITNFPLDEEGNLKIKVAEEPLQVHKDSIKIDVLNWATRQWGDYGYQREWGIYVRETFPEELCFAFSPKQSFVNLTNIIVVIFATGSLENFVLKINGVNTLLGTASFPVDLPSAKRIQLDTNVVQINEGINMLRLSGTGYDYLSVYEISVFLEYEYLA